MMRSLLIFVLASGFSTGTSFCQKDSLKAWKNDFQTGIFETIDANEREIINTFRSNCDEALQRITNLTNSFAERDLKETREKLMQIKSRGL